MKNSLLLATGFLAFSAQAEFQNIPGVPGALISQTHPELGRLTTIEVLGDYVIAIPEIPSSPTGSELNTLVLDISDPTNPITVMNLGRTAQPILAHGTYKRGNEVYIGGFPEDAIRLDSDGSLSHVRWSGPDAHFNPSGMYYPWAARHWWSYGSTEGLAWLDFEGVRQTEWDHLGLTGVVGFPTVMGNLLIYASDQSFSGMATYDISDPENPVLLDVFNLPSEHPTFTQRQNSSDVPIEYGLGGYWNAPHGHYMVFARNGDNPGVQVVDFKDPTNLRLHCEILFQDPKLDLPKRLAPDAGTRDVQYLNFQDEYIFAERLKINIETCELDLVLDEVGSGVETSQYQRPIGNMLLTGGAQNFRLRNRGLQEGGLGIFYHQAEPDDKPPYVAHHIPKNGQENYPTAAPISIMIPETLHATTIIPGDTLIVEDVGGKQIEVDYLLSHTGVLTINPLEELTPEKQYRVKLERISDAVGNLLEPYSFEFTTGSNSNVNRAPDVENLTIPSRQALQPGQNLSLTVNAADPDGDELQYRFRITRNNVGEYGEFSSSPSFTQTIEEVGTYTLTAQVRDTHGAIVARTARLTVVEATQPLVKSVSSSSLALTEDDANLWVVNPDNLGIANLSVPDMELVREPRNSKKPVGISIDSNGHRWVVYQGQDRINLVNRFGGTIHTIQLDYGAKPSSIIIDNANHFAYVALEGKGEIIKINTLTQKEVARVSNVDGVRSMALSGNGQLLLATRFISPQNHGEVYGINPLSMTLTKTIELNHSLENDTVIDGRGVPNYLAHVVIDGNSRFAYVAAKKDNIARGAINNNAPLDDDSTVRTLIAMIDLNTLEEVIDARIDIDNADSPSALALSLNEGFLFVALQGNNRIGVLNRNIITGRLSRTVNSNIAVGLAPQGLLLNNAGDKLYVKNFTSRTVSQIDLSNFNRGNTVNPPVISARSVRQADEELTEQELLGKQIFYNASFGIDEQGEFTGRTSAEGYLSCASCHSDGGEDGRVYDFTGRGEGLRNNLTLNGRASDGDVLLHWSGSFDEIQDFENDIRHQFLGRGLMTDSDFESTEDPLGARKAGLSDDLDALAAYVNSLDKSSVERSPYRTADGAMTTSASAGHDVFVALNCQSCHYRYLFSDRKTHDVGTLRTYSGLGSNGNLDAIRTPFLLGLFNTAPYLHDGSAATIEEVFKTIGGKVTQAEDALLLDGAKSIDAGEFSYFRQGRAVKAPNASSILISAESATNRSAYVRVRYGSALENTQLVMEVNGKKYIETLAVLPPANGENVAFAEAKFIVDFIPGSNEIKLSPNMLGTRYDLILDDITVSTPRHEKAARVHTRVNDLPSLEKAQLFDYLQQIDQGKNVTE